jgi:hypothetical protein
MVNELCDSVSLGEMIEFSSMRLSKNVQSLSILDIVDWNEESVQQRPSFLL